MKRKSIYSSMITIPGIALIAVLLILGCGGGSTGDGNGNNNTYPQVLYCYPDDGNTDIPINCIVTIIFDRAIDTDSIVDAFVIQPDAPGNCNWSNGNTKLEYTPSDYLQPNTKYTVMITTLAKDAEGNPLEESFSWSFTTGAIIDITPPTVGPVSPADWEIDILIDVNISITFSEPMNTSSVEDAFSLSDGTNISGTFGWNGNTMTFNPSNNLNYGTWYFVIVGTGAMDATGINIENEFNSRFETLQNPGLPAPEVDLVLPLHLEDDISISTNVSITFTEPMNTSSAQNAFSLSDGTNISGTFSWNGNIMTFNPSNNLEYDTWYFVTVGTGAMDTTGINMILDFNSSFRTIEEHPVVPVQGGAYPMGYPGVFLEVHSVTLSSFSMGIYEVTNAQVVDVFNWANGQSKFQTVTSLTVTNVGNSQELIDLDDVHCNIQYSGGIFSARTDLGDDGSGGTVDVSNYPCAEITWYGAAAFCNYLSEIEGLTPFYNLSNWSYNFSANGYRLATEAEWEYAARYIDGQYNNFRAGDSFSGSDTAGDVAWYIDNSSETPHNDIADGYGTHEVGLKDPNVLSIYDMSGNVNEWCHDWSNDAPYPSTSQTNPTGPSSGTYRIIRGGGAGGTTDEGLRTSHRWHAVPYESMDDVGFRVVKRP